MWPSCSNRKDAFTKRKELFLNWPFPAAVEITVMITFHATSMVSSAQDDIWRSFLGNHNWHELVKCKGRLELNKKLVAGVFGDVFAPCRLPAWSTFGDVKHHCLRFIRWQCLPNDSIKLILKYQCRIEPDTNVPLPSGGSINMSTGGACRRICVCFDVQPPLSLIGTVWMASQLRLY